MKLFYKHYERPSFELPQGGYIMTDEMKESYQFANHYANEMSDFIVPTEDNINYFDEANVVIRINSNLEGCFDFDKAILDIGAGVGCYSIRTNFKSVYAFEPNKTLYALLNMNLLLHDKLDHSKTYNDILAETNKDVLYDGVHTIMDDQYIPNIDSSKVKILEAKIIDDYDLKNVGLIRIDLDGMEENVLRGAIGTIVKNDYPPIVFKMKEPSNYTMTITKFESMMYFLDTICYNCMSNYGHEDYYLATYRLKY